MGRSMSRLRFAILAPDVVGEIIAKRVGSAGGQRAAARESGVSQAQLSRLVRGTSRRITEDVLERLLNWVPLHGASLLVAAVLGHEPLAVRDRYYRWLVRRSGFQIRYGVGQGWGVRPPQPAVKRADRREQLLDQLKALVPELFRWFDTQLEKSPARPNEARRAVAYDRVLDPFLDFETSGGVELGVQDLSTPSVVKLKKILDYGMKRELLLLNRPPDEERFRVGSAG